MPRLSFSGFDRVDEAHARATFEALALPGWSLAPEAEADAVLLDLDSMYGQMAWMKGIEPGKVAIGLTHALRADTPYRLDAPLSPDALAAVLRKIGATVGGTLDGAAPISAVASSASSTELESAATAAPAAEAAAPPPVSVAAPAPAPSRSTLATLLARAGDPFAVEADGLPRLVIDPQRQQFAPGRSLKALLGFATRELPAGAILELGADDAAAALSQAGDPQPLGRLAWLLALGGGEGRVLGHGPGTRFQLGKWPQVEREFPKHFRIATVMLKAPATVAEIALGSGASEAEVADYVNAALAAGHASAN